jgi:hypothetical protein
MDILNIILGGSLVISLWGAYKLHKQVETLERYASVVSCFAKEISEYSEEETNAMFKQFARKAYEKMAEE